MLFVKLSYSPFQDLPDFKKIFPKNIFSIVFIFFFSPKKIKIKFPKKAKQIER